MILLLYMYALILHIDAMLVLVHYDGIVIMLFFLDWLAQLISRIDGMCPL